jgi:hypothetical protein
MSSALLDKGESSCVRLLCVFVIFTINLSFRFRSKQSSSGSSSIGVIRTDSDVFDGILFDGDSRGSSVSLNSTCSARSHQDHNLTGSSNGMQEEMNLNVNG